MSKHFTDNLSKTQLKLFLDMAMSIGGIEIEKCEENNCNIFFIESEYQNKIVDDDTKRIYDTDVSRCWNCNKCWCKDHSDGNVIRVEGDLYCYECHDTVFKK